MIKKTGGGVSAGIRRSEIIYYIALLINNFISSNLFTVPPLNLQKHVQCLYAALFLCAQCNLAQRTRARKWKWLEEPRPPPASGECCALNRVLWYGCGLFGGFSSALLILGSRRRKEGHSLLRRRQADVFVPSRSPRCSQVCLLNKGGWMVSTEGLRATLTSDWATWHGRPTADGPLVVNPAVFTPLARSRLEMSEGTCHPHNTPTRRICCRPKITQK